MGVVAHHIAFGAAAASLVGAAIRLASLAAPDGLERLVAAAPLAAGAAVIEALALGLVGLGASPVALTAAALATWLLARARLPAPAISVPADAARAWRAHGAGVRIAVLALCGLLVGWAAWLVTYPFLDVDAIAYHLPEIVAWVQNGQTGQFVDLNHDFPVGYYPVTNEVLVTWGSGITRSFAPPGLASPAALALAIAAGWSGLRARAVPPATAGLAIAAVVTGPIVVVALAGPDTDLPALAWLAVVGALCAGVDRRPGLLAPALVAAGLAIGTKTTTAPLVAIMLAITLVHARAHLRALWRPLALAAAAAAFVGGIWYVRNLLVHGWPLWPFQATSFSDPMPVALKRVDFSFLERPRATLRGREGDYAAQLAGYVVLLGGIAVAPLLARRRSVTAAAGVAGLALLAWIAAPFTGVADNPILDLSLSAVRYLLPAVAAAATATALAARRGGLATGLANLVLGAAVVWNVLRDNELGPPFAPAAIWLLAGAAGGVLVALAAARLSRGTAPRLPAGVFAGAAATVAAIGLVAVADGYVERHGRTRAYDSGAVHYIADQPGYRGGTQPVAGAGVPLGPLAGDELRHPVPLIPARERCAVVRQRARRGWVTFQVNPFPQFVAPSTNAGCLATLRPVQADASFAVYHLGDRTP